MAVHKKALSKCDDYMTPRSAWENIEHIIPKNKLIWEAFYGDGTSGNVLTELGFDIIHEDIDFFNENRGEIVVSNPPFSKKQRILKRLVELDKPFILIMPTGTLNTQYTKKLFMDKQDKLKIIIPRNRIHFTKLINGVAPQNWKNACNFDCYYFCWKIDGLERDITWLD